MNLSGLLEEAPHLGPKVVSDHKFSDLNSPLSFPEQALVFMCLQYKSFVNAIPPFPTVFSPFGELSAVFHQI